MEFNVKSGLYKGVVSIPASKSDSQRALLLSSMASGKSTLKNVGSSADELAMLKTIKAFGANVTISEDNSLVVDGAFDLSNINSIHCGESGLGLRLLTAISSLGEKKISLDGEGSLRKRDQRFFEHFLPKMGVELKSNNGKLPIDVKGPLKAGEYTVDGSESSQYISGLLIAFSQVDGLTKLTVENLASRPYVDMTLATLRQFGVNVKENETNVFTIVGKQEIRATTYTIDGDWSAASFWLVASALGLDVSVQGLSMASKQADKAMLNALMRANCGIVTDESGLKIDGSNRKPIDFDATHCPDLFPALATYAALTTGISKIRGVHRLANKESDRTKALQEEFEKLGVKITIDGDEMLVHGSTNILAATVSAHNDHRIAMCLAVAGMASGVTLTVEGAESVAKSYPNFWKDVENLFS